MTAGPTRPGAIEIGPGPPAFLAALGAPVVAVALIASRAASSGLSAGPDDPIPPMLVAVLTVVVALVLSWRCLTQRASLDIDVLRCRNALVTFEIPWEQVERLDIVHRLGIVVIDVRIMRFRRRHRIGAATRLSGAEAEAMLDMLRAHPVAASLLHDPGLD
jgi:hypothetical protein